MDKSVLLVVVDEDQDLLLGKRAKLNGFLQEPSLPFLESDVSLEIIFNFFDTYNFALSHGFGFDFYSNK